MDRNESLNALLIAVARNNDQAAYKSLFVLMYDRLKQFAYTITRSSEEAEEVVSDVFVRLWEKRALLAEIDSPKTYLYSAVKNQAITRLKTQRKIQALPDDIWFVQAGSFYFNPEEMMATNEILKKFKQAIQDLPPRCRIIFKLVKEDGLKYREVAEVLDISIKTVEAQMAIALKRVAKCMYFELSSFSTAGMEIKK